MSNGTVEDILEKEASDHGSPSEGSPSHAPNTPNHHGVGEANVAIGGVSFGLDALIQSALTTLSLALINALLTEMHFWAGYMANLVQMAWTGLLQACYLSVDVLKLTVVEAINLLLCGGHQVHAAVEVLKSAGPLVYEIFKGAIESIKTFMNGPIQLPAHVEDVPDNISLD